LAILNRPNNGQVSVLVALWRSLSELGPLSEAELLAVCAPSPLLSADSQRQAPRTLSTWAKLGLFESDGEALRLGAHVKGVDTDPAADPLLRKMGARALDIAMRPVNNGDVAEPKGDDAGGASDFSYAICWMLSQDPHEAWSYSLADTRQTSRLDASAPRPIQNDVNWPGLVDWATFFGLGWSVAGSLFVDPTEAIRIRLKEIFDGEGRLTQVDFVDRLTARLPILHNGAYRRAAERHFPEDHRVDDAVFSVSLSHALLALESMGEIQLFYQPDGGQFRSLSDRKPDYFIARGRSASVTHVELVSK